MLNTDTFKEDFFNVSTVIIIFWSSRVIFATYDQLNISLEKLVTVELDQSSYHPETPSLYVVFSEQSVLYGFFREQGINIRKTVLLAYF